MSDTSSATAIESVSSLIGAQHILRRFFGSVQILSQSVLSLPELNDLQSDTVWASLQSLPPILLDGSLPPMPLLGEGSGPPRFSHFKQPAHVRFVGQALKAQN